MRMRCKLPFINNIVHSGNFLRSGLQQQGTRLCQRRVQDVPLSIPHIEKIPAQYQCQNIKARPPCHCASKHPSHKSLFTIFPLSTQNPTPETQNIFLLSPRCSVLSTGSHHNQIKNAHRSDEIQIARIVPRRSFT